MVAYRPRAKRLRFWSGDTTPPPPPPPPPSSPSSEPSRRPARPPLPGESRPATVVRHAGDGGRAGWPASSRYGSSALPSASAFSVQSSSFRRRLTPSQNSRSSRDCSTVGTRKGKCAFGERSLSRLLVVRCAPCRRCSRASAGDASSCGPFHGSSSCPRASGTRSRKRIAAMRIILGDGLPRGEPRDLLLYLFARGGNARRAPGAPRGPRDRLLGGTGNPRYPSGWICDCAGADWPRAGSQPHGSRGPREPPPFCGAPPGPHHRGAGFPIPAWRLPCLAQGPDGPLHHPMVLTTPTAPEPYGGASEGGRPRERKDKG